MGRDLLGTLEYGVEHEFIYCCLNMNTGMSRAGGGWGGRVPPTRSARPVVFLVLCMHA